MEELYNIKQGDLVYLHKIDRVDIREGVKKGIYEVVHCTGDSMRVFVNNTNDSHFLYSDQVYKIVPNNINKLLYKELS